MLALESVEIRLDESAGEFARAVGAEIHEDDAVSVLHLHRVANDRGFDEFVRFVPGISIVQAFDGGLGAEFRLALGEQVIGRLYPQPAVIAVHGVIAADNRSDLADFQGVDLVLQALQVDFRALGRRVAAIQKGVQVDFFQAEFGRHFDHGVDVVFVAVNAAIRHQAEYVQGAIVAF